MSRKDKDAEEEDYFGYAKDIENVVENIEHESQLERLEFFIDGQVLENTRLENYIRNARLTRQSVVELRTSARKLSEALVCINDMYDAIRDKQPQVVAHLTKRVDQVCRDIGVLRSLVEEKIKSLRKAESIVSSKSRGSTSSAAASIRRAELELAAKRAELLAQLEQDKIDAEKKQLELEEARQRAELEAKQRALDRKRLQDQYDIEEAKVKALSDAYSERSASGQRRSVLMLRDNIKRESLTRCEVTVKSEAMDSTLSRSKFCSKSKQSVLSGEVVENLRETSSEHLIRTLAESLSLQRLPAVEPHVFCGDPLAYTEWLTTFDMMVDKKPLSTAEKLYYLKQYVSGPAKEAVRGYFMLNSAEAYENAKATLQERYGDPFVLTEAYRDKLSKWPKTSGKDKVGLRRYSDFLQHCVSAMAVLPDLFILNDVRENRRMIDKLPEWLVNRWGRVIAKSKEVDRKFPKFKEFASFLKKESDILCEPVLSDPVEMHKSTQESLKQVRGKATIMKTSTVENERCLVCEKSNHNIENCFTLQRMPLNEKREFVIRHRLCFGCLKVGHIAKECPARLKCDECKGRHPTSLHETLKQDNSEDKRDSSNEEPTLVSCKRTGVIGEQKSIMSSMTVPVWLYSKEAPEKQILVYAMLDSQSDTSFILRQTGERLGVLGKPVTLSLSTLTSSSKRVNSVKYNNLMVRGYHSKDAMELPSLYSREYIPVEREHIPTKELANHFPHLRKIADEIPSLQNCEVGLLIGYNCGAALLPTNCIAGNNNEPFAVRTMLGWSIVGKQERNLEGDVIGITNRTIAKVDAQGGRTVIFKAKTPVKEDPVLACLEKDFSPDNSSVMMSMDDFQFLSTLESGIYQTESHGKYCMPLPFKHSTRPKLPNNYSVALHRFRLLERKFRTDAKYYMAYKAFMEEVLQGGEAEEVPGEVETLGECWYIPHFGVFHPKKPGKIRVVFDCAAKYRGVDLNSHLLPGPDQLNNLVGILCRFRQHEVAFMGDIEKMFHQFIVKPEDRDYLRFLWYDSRGDKLLTYRMCVHLFGAASSPGCATFGLRKVAEDYKSIDGQAANYIIRDFYVDDGLTSTSTTSEAIHLIKRAREICAHGHLRLHKFISNNREVMMTIPTSERNKIVQNLDLDADQLPVERALGVEWLTDTDELSFKISLENRQPWTRRTVLSTVASIFDPLGLLSPFVLKGKLVLQELCRERYDWDDTLAPKLNDQWETWCQELSLLAQVHLPRCLIVSRGPMFKSYEVHHFSDASTLGYGACSYLRVVYENGEVHCSLLLAKARVASLKTQTIPRMELQAAVAAARLAKVLSAELTYPDVKHLFWTDSKIVLGLITNRAKKNPVFTANRLREIDEQSNPNQWGFVSSSNNPADHASRGLGVKELQTTNWFRGPEFLWSEPVVKPANLGPSTETTSITLFTSTSPENFNVIERLGRFSIWAKAVNAVAILQQCINQKTWKYPHLSVANRVAAEKTIFKLLQGQHFAGELQRLKQGKCVMRKSVLFKLDPFIDEEGILRIGGRLKNATCLSEEEKNPIILPKGNHLTLLLVRYLHEKTFHQGKSITLAKIRSSGFWIIGCVTLVASVLSRCVVCRKLRYGGNMQKMSDLPTI